MNHQSIAQAIVQVEREQKVKVFWWQGGLHAEPETVEEGKAMRLLYDTVRRFSIAAKGGDGPKKLKAANPGAERTARVSETLRLK